MPCCRDEKKKNGEHYGKNEFGRHLLFPATTVVYVNQLWCIGKHSNLDILFIFFCIFIVYRTTIIIIIIILLNSVKRVTH